MICSMNMPRKITAGEGAVMRLPDILRPYGSKKILLATDRGIFKTGLIDPVENLLKKEGYIVSILNDIPQEPDKDSIAKLYKSIKGDEFDAVVGIGGGSVMDTAKLIAVMLSNNIDIYRILETKNITKRDILSVMIPTTAGTGSEATPNAIVTIPEHESKTGIVSDYMVPDEVILDPLMTTGLPANITASTGMDALTHSIECYISKKANPFSDMYALRSIKLIFDSIMTAFSDGKNIKARYDMLLASFYGGMCIASSGTAAVHAMAYPLGGKYHIPHGVSNAMLLAKVIDFNSDSCAKRLRDIAVAAGICDEYEDENKASGLLVKSLQGLTNTLKIPVCLSTYGIMEDDLEELAISALNVTRLLVNNPKDINKGDMIKIYRQLL